MSGWKIFDTNSALTERHVFAQGTIVPVNGAIVIFGGGTPTGTFGGSIVQTATTGALGLTNSSDGIIIEDATATEIISYTYGSEAGSDQSITRSPDITGSDNPMVAHSTATGSGGALFSPGTKIDGIPFIEGSVTQVEFNMGSAYIEEGVVTYELEVSILGADDINATSVDVVLISGDATDINNYMTQTVTFPAGVSDIQILTISINDDSEIEADESLVFELQNISGGNNAELGVRTNFELTITDNDFASTSLVLNEYLAWPAGASASANGPEVDANGDGTISFRDDEFMEFVNEGTEPLDITGWQIYDGITTPTARHIFPEGTSIVAGGALVVFGGGNPTGSFGGATVQLASNEDLSLLNSGDEIVVKNSEGQRVLVASYGEQTRGSSESLVPDITGSYVLHPTLNDFNISPGTKIDGTPFIESEVSIVEFLTGAATVNEGDGTFDLAVKILFPDDIDASTVEVVLISGDALNINDYTTQLLTFPAGSSANQTLTLEVTDDTEVEGDQILMFELQNLSGGSEAELGSLTTFELTIEDNDFASSSLVLNEFLAWPAGAASSANGPEVDANGDGVADFNDDEFIELVNDGNVDLDISGWQIYDAFTSITERHVFPNGTLINPGGALVVFGGGVPTGEFGGAQIQVSSTESLGFTNGNDEIIIRNSAGDVVISLAYGQQTRGTSTTLNPDITGALGPHPELNGINISPGTKVDGTPFEVATRTTVQFVSASGGIEEQAGTFVVELSIERASETEATMAEVVVLTEGYEMDFALTQSDVIFPAGSSENQFIEISVINDEELEGDELFVLQLQNISGGTRATSGVPATFSFIILDDDVPLIFNEIHADPAFGLEGDANNDGIRDPEGDEFIEVVNRSQSVIDISGYQFFDAASLRHVFEDGTFLEPGRAMLVFGGGIPVGQFGNSKVQLASEGGGLSLTNTGDELKIFDADGNIQAGMTYNDLANDDQSIVRSPDIIGGFVLHSTVDGADGRLYSPGTKSNGDLFINFVLADKKQTSGFVKVYPNPAKNSISFSFEEKNDDYQLRIINSQGKLMVTKELQGATENVMDVSSLNSGLYFYQILPKTSNEVSGSGKILIK